MEASLAKDTKKVRRAVKEREGSSEESLLSSGEKKSRRKGEKRKHKKKRAVPSQDEGPGVGQENVGVEDDSSSRQSLDRSVGKTIDDPEKVESKEVLGMLDGSETVVDLTEGDSTGQPTYANVDVIEAKETDAWLVKDRREASSDDIAGQSSEKLVRRRATLTEMGESFEKEQETNVLGEEVSHNLPPP